MQGWDAAGLATFELVDMHATARNFIKFPVDRFSTFVGFPSAMMRLAHDATHALPEDSFSCCAADGNVSLHV